MFILLLELSCDGGACNFEKEGIVNILVDPCTNSTENELEFWLLVCESLNLVWISFIFEKAAYQ